MKTTIVALVISVLLVGQSLAQHSIVVTAPNGGENLQIGSTFRILWSHSGTYNSFTIQISRNGGSTWSTIESGLPGHYTYRDWSASSPASSACKIRVTGYYTGGSIYDQSNSNFAVLGTMNVTYPTSGTTLWKGHTYYFSWNSQYVTGNVRVQVLRSGSLYYTLAANDPNDGSLQFVAPFDDTQTPGYSWPEDGNYQIRVEALDGTGSATSGYFSIARPTLDVTYPDGGQTMYQGSTINITWSNNQVESGQPILLQWYRGSTADQLITASASNTGSYSYTIPCSFPTGTNLRIGMSAYNGEVYNFSNGYNSIYSFPAPELSTPANGGSLQGPSYVFTWSPVSGASAYHIKIATEPTFSNPIVNDIGISGASTSYAYAGSLTWNTTHYWQMQALKGSCWGDWTGVRSFTPIPVLGVINVTSPAAGSTLWKGHEYTIQWNSQNVSGDVRVQVLRSGSLHATLSASYANSGSHPFEVPFGTNQWPNINWPEDGNYQIRVEALNGNGSGTSGYFTILRPSLDVTYPDGGQTLAQGQNINITWNQNQVEAGEPILLQWYRGSTAIEPPITTGAPNTGSFNHTVPCSIEPGSDLNIGMSAYAGEVYDYSDGYSTITEIAAPTILTPTQNSQLQGPPYNFTWTPVAGATQYRLKVSRVPDFTSTEFDDNTIPSSNTSYEYNNYLQWNTVHYAQMQAKRNGCWGAFSAVRTFTPQEAPASLSLISPNGGETWQFGQPVSITWSSSGSIANLAIHLYRQGSQGQMVYSIAAGAPNTGSFDWNVPATLTSANDYYIGISDASDGNPWDFSNGPFSIVVETAITVASPNGGETLEENSTYTITWTSAGNIPNVLLHLYKGAAPHGTYLQSISESHVNTGSYSWNVPASLEAGTDYYIRIADATDSNPSDYSNSAFAITDESVDPPVLPSLVFDFPVSPPDATPENDGDGWYVCQGFQELIDDYCNHIGSGNHLGEDWNAEASPYADQGQPVYAVADGIVRFAYDTNSNCWQGVILIDHSAGMGHTYLCPDGSRVNAVTSFYGHLGRASINEFVNEGDPVEKGDPIGRIGTSTVCPLGTGGPHLHFEMRTNLAIGISPGYSSPDGYLNPTEFILLNHNPCEQTAASTTRWHPNGSVIKTASSSAVYLIDNSELYPFVNEGLFLGNRYSWNQVITVSEAELAGYCSISGYPEDLSGDAVFRINELPYQDRVWMKYFDAAQQMEVRSRILTQGILFSHGFDWGNVQDVGSEHTYAQLPQAQPRLYREGSLIKGDASSSVYVMDNGYLRPLESEGVFDDLGLCWGNLITVPQADINNYTGCLGVGEMITAGIIISLPLCDDTDAPYPSVAYSGQSSSPSREVSIDWSLLDNGELGSAYLQFTHDSWISYVQISEDNLLNSDRSENSAGVFQWSVPDQIAGVVTVRLIGEDAAGNIASDYTEEFTIAPPSPAIELLYPNAGSYLQACSNVDVQWSSIDTLGSLRIELNRDYPDGTWETVTSSTSNDGEYSVWITAPTSSKARFRISSNSYQSVWDVSDENSSIDGLEIQIPNGGETYVSGEVQTLFWLPNGTEAYDVDIDLNRDYPNGTWSTIVESAENDGEASWIVTGPATNSARFRIRGGDNCISDISNGSFLILAPSISVQTPTIGEQWIPGTTHDVEWLSENLQGNIRIDLYRMCQTCSLETIAENTPNDGSFSWLVENTISTSAQIIVSSLYYPSITDTSAEFELLGLSELNLVLQIDSLASQIILHWKPDYQATEYRVYSDSTSNGTFEDFITVLPPETLLVYPILPSIDMRFFKVEAIH